VQTIVLHTSVRARREGSNLVGDASSVPASQQIEQSDIAALRKHDNNDQSRANRKSVSGTLLNTSIGMSTLLLDRGAVHS
jgi:hypothetical protein